MHLDKILNLVDQKKPFKISENWAQGRTVYGGLSACIAYKAAVNELKNIRPIRTMSCNFVAPFNIEQEFVISCEVLREGKNVSSVQTSLIQDEQVKVRAQFVFGEARDTEISIDNKIKHSMQVPIKSTFIPNIPGLTPQFLTHFDLKFDAGDKPFSGSDKSHIHGWVRLSKQSEHLSHAHLIAMIDAWPPTLLQKLNKPAPGSTMTWNLNFVNPSSDFSKKNWFAYQASTLQYSQGYGLTTANFWDSEGNLLAISSQNVTIFG